MSPPTPPSVLLLTSDRLASPASIGRATELGAGAPPAVASSAGGLAPGDVPAAAFSTVLLTGVGPGGAGAGLLRLAATALAPGGRLELEEGEGVQVCVWREGSAYGTAKIGDARALPPRSTSQIGRASCRERV